MRASCLRPKKESRNLDIHEDQIDIELKQDKEEEEEEEEK